MAEYTEAEADYMHTVAANTPKGYYLVCGWPAEEHNAGWNDYIEQCKDVLDELDEGDDAPTFAPYERWRDDRLGEGADDLGFSMESCDLCCSHLGGNRFAVTAMPLENVEGFVKRGDYYALSVCADCLMYIANGDLPDHLGEGR